eukprot:TRINITY_DN44349_c0_g1_i1.p1 TRINITY_DN44349_c0_g1~~TRINITY_DN44349_c0_g1_i1.p1  ORF type:complete len:110 (-),score=0.59 TRINITY_DN44349_c0_g1_i1:268-597(-)
MFVVSFCLLVLRRLSGFTLSSSSAASDVYKRQEYMGIQTDPLRLVIDSRYCIGCGLCQAICPENAVSMVEQKHPVIGVSLEGQEPQGSGANHLDRGRHRRQPWNQPSMD